MDAPLSHESVVAGGTGLMVLGGITPAGNSLSTVSAINVQTGAVSSAGELAEPVHDAAAVVIGSSAVVFGGGSPDTVSTVQRLSFAGSQPVIGPRDDDRQPPSAALRPGGRHRQEVNWSRSRALSYIVGGYDGTNYLPTVLSTTDGIHFTSVADLRVPVRYPAVVADGGVVYAFGGETSATGAPVAATNDIQRIDPATHTVSVVGHLPQPLYGAAAFAIAGTLYVAGGQVPGGPTLTQIDAFIPSTGKVLECRSPPPGRGLRRLHHRRIGTWGRRLHRRGGGGRTGRCRPGGWIGSLQSVISLRTSRYGGPAGSTGAGSPYSGTLLIADRGNDRLIALDAGRQITWQYPSATMPPPPGGFYFPDDAFFIKAGTGIISNQEDNHTIVEIGYPSGKLLWQYGHPGQPGSAPGYLDQPDDAYLLKSGTITVADASNNRILFISPQGQIVGQIGNGADVHNPPVSIAYPNGDTPLVDGNVLVSEINGSWVDEYTPAGKLVWTVHIPTVNYPSDPQQIGPDLYLMTDYDPPAEGRILEFTREGASPGSTTPKW